MGHQTHQCQQIRGQSRMIMIKRGHSVISIHALTFVPTSIKPVGNSCHEVMIYLSPVVNFPHFFADLGSRAKGESDAFNNKRLLSIDSHLSLFSWRFDLLLRHMASSSRGPRCHCPPRRRRPSRKSGMWWLSPQTRSSWNEMAKLQRLIVTQLKYVQTENLERFRSFIIIEQ